MKVLKSRVAVIMAEQGLSPGELSYTTGLTPTTISKWRDRSYYWRRLDVDTALKIMSALGCGFGDLFEVVSEDE